MRRPVWLLLLLVVIELARYLARHLLVISELLVPSTITCPVLRVVVLAIWLLPILLLLVVPTVLIPIPTSRRERRRTGREIRSTRVECRRIV